MQYKGFAIRRAAQLPQRLKYGEVRMTRVRIYLTGIRV